MDIDAETPQLFIVNASSLMIFGLSSSNIKYGIEVNFIWDWPKDGSTKTLLINDRKTCNNE